MPYSILDSDTRKLEPFYLYQPFAQEEWDNYPFASEEELQWFHDAKLGLFLHVGISAVGGVDIGWPRQTHKLPDGRVGEVPDEVYDSWAEQIKFEDFDAKKWAALAKQAGMKYVVVITKHHDGFHMWDTEYSDYKITNAPFGRDYLKEVLDAMRAEGLKVGVYYSQRDWVHPDYEPVDPKTCTVIPAPPYFEMNPGEEFRVTEKHKRYIEYMHNTVKELMTNYGKIDMLWWDACWWGGMFSAEMWDADRLEREVRKLQPGILINNRASLPGDFDTPECSIGFFQNNRPWETCMPLGQDWAWSDKEIKSFPVVLRQFLNCVCGDGNYLLSVGVKANGDFDTPEKTRFAQLGEWLEKYGESVYKTRGGPWRPGTWGGSTYRENIIYLQFLNPQSEDTLKLPFLGNRVMDMVSLNGHGVEMHQDEEWIAVHLTSDNKDDVETVKLIMENPVTELEEKDFALGLFQESPALYGDELDCRVEKENNDWILHFPEEIVLTGLWIDCNSRVRVLLQENGEWVEFVENNEIGVLEIPVTRYEAGASIIGRPAVSVRVEALDGEIQVIKPYGFVGEK